ncbi:MAG: hypothetical protein GY862_31545 [Gammaproteobacteria bacterium]|nr:hypothetical protein [Gammaproteobacteria bacterium]
MRNMMPSLISLTFLLTALNVGAIEIEDVEVPHTFYSGTKARAAEVNASFDALAAKINELNALVAQLQNMSSGWCTAFYNIPLLNFNK